jgi:hypothetical protein
MSYENKYAESAAYYYGHIYMDKGGAAAKSYAFVFQMPGRAILPTLQIAHWTIPEKYSDKNLPVSVIHIGRDWHDKYLR